MSTQAPAGGASDLLSSIMGVTIRNEEKIAAEDREFCEDRQTKLHTVLRQLQWWYGLFTTNAEPYRKSRNLTYEENGSIDKYNCRNVYHSEDSDDYSAFEFMPFHSINEVVELYGKAVMAFANDIIRHFNRRYNVSVPMPEIDDKKLPPGFMPTYQIYVDQVITHLGGKDFRETAEEELLKRFHSEVMPGYSKTLKAELKGDKIVVASSLWYENYSWNDTLHLSWNSATELNTLCAGIIFGTTGGLNGSMDFIEGYDRNDVDLSRWYRLDIGESVSAKFFKNRRVDFRFENATIAERCWKKLRLDTIKPKSEDE